GIGVAVILLLIILPQAIKIVPEYQRMMVFRLGRAIGTKGPGLIILIPVIDRGIRVDLREQYLEIPHQTAITEDNAPISIDFIVFTKVVDAAMSAERTRRAVVTEADGSKQAAITVAEGNKQSAILNAEGDRQAAILRAEGFSLALSKIFDVAHTIDANTMSLQYLDALKVIGTS